jgi:hypothetical protein
MEGGTGTVVSVLSGSNLALSELTIQKGSPGIYNVGTLQISNSTIQNNFPHPSCISACHSATGFIGLN